MQEHLDAGQLRSKPRKYAKGRSVRRKPGEMNGWESKYAAELDALKAAGIVEWWAFDSTKLRLASLTFYTPDFFVMYADASMEFIEVKGHWEDDARVKIKVAASLYPMFSFVAVKPKAKKNGGGWEREEF